MQIRKSYYLALFVLVILVLDLGLVFMMLGQRHTRKLENQQMIQLVTELGLSDLAVTTEARYTRHPAVTDPLVPFMDHPGNIEHFPSGSFYRPVE